MPSESVPFEKTKKNDEKNKSNSAFLHGDVSIQMFMRERQCPWMTPFEYLSDTLAYTSVDDAVSWM